MSIVHLVGWRDSVGSPSRLDVDGAEVVTVEGEHETTPTTTPTTAAIRTLARHRVIKRTMVQVWRAGKARSAAKTVRSRR